MLRCTACRLEIAPFAMTQPEVARRCHRCGAELTFSEASRTEIQVHGPALPPVPAGISVERRDGSESYRESAGGTLVIRWKPPFDPRLKAMLGIAAGLTVVTTVGAVFLGSILWPITFLLLGMTLLLAILPWLTKGEVRVESGLLHARRSARRGKRTTPVSAVATLWVVDIGQEQSFDGSSEIWMRSPDGTSAALVSGLPTGRVPHYVVARLRQELGVD